MTLFNVEITRPGQAPFAYARGLSYREAKRAYADCVALYGNDADLTGRSYNSFSQYADGLRIAIS